MFSGRRGQASQAGTLIIIIALLLIVYMTLLPPSSREDLLGNSSNMPTEPPASNFLSYAPSNSVDEGIQVRQLPVFTLRTAIQGNLLAERSSVSVQSSVFDSDSEIIGFRAPIGSENILLSFSVAEAKGFLELVLNGEVIYSAQVNRRQPDPILLPMQNIQPDNELEVRVSGVGFSFWDTNRYLLSDVRITADVTSRERASQVQRFVIQDADTIQQASLEFVPDCYQESGRFELMHNNNLIYSGFPVCGVPLSIDLAPGQMQEGQNFLTFSIAGGEYIIDQAEIVILREREENKGEFSISQQQLQDITARNADILLSLSFREPGARGTVIVNGQELQFRTNEQSFANSIFPFVTSGTNTVTLQSSTIPVTLIEVYEE